jgi:hypothetical protein
MKKRKILLLLFMISGLFSYLSLSLFHLLLLITQVHNAHHISYIAIPWMLGTSILAVIPLIGSKKWILQHRHLFLFSCAIWPLLDGLMFLENMITCHDIPWSMDLVVLGCFITMSLLGILASLLYAQPKARETALIFCLFIGISAIWEYFRFGNFSYGYLYFTGLIIAKLLAPEEQVESV